jgi:hypothetical protein
MLQIFAPTTDFCTYMLQIFAPTTDFCTYILQIYVPTTDFCTYMLQIFAPTIDFCTAYCFFKLDYARGFLGKRHYNINTLHQLHHSM